MRRCSDGMKTTMNRLYDHIKRHIKPEQTSWYTCQLSLTKINPASGVFRSILRGEMRKLFFQISKKFLIFFPKYSTDLCLYEKYCAGGEFGHCIPFHRWFIVGFTLLCINYFFNFYVLQSLNLKKKITQRFPIFQHYLRLTIKC